MKITRLRNKTYVLVHGHELQYGHISRSVVVWTRNGRLIRIKRVNRRRVRRHFEATP